MASSQETPSLDFVWAELKALKQEYEELSLRQLNTEVRYILNILRRLQN